MEIGSNSYWTVDTDQMCITGDKTGSYNLTTTGNITTNTLLAQTGIFNGTGEPAIDCPGNMAIVGINASGRVNASSLQGEGGNITGVVVTDGSALINLNGSNISSGTIAEARIANSSVWTAKLATTGTGTGLTALNASNLTSGTVDEARIANSSVWTAKLAPTGAGVALTSLNASNASEGTLPEARLANASTWTAKLATTGSAAALTNIPAANLTGSLSLKNQTKGFVILNVNTTDDFRLPKQIKSITYTNITAYLLGPASANCTLEELNSTGNGTNKIIATLNITNNTEYIGTVTSGEVLKGNYSFFNISALGAGNGSLEIGLGYDEN